MPSPQDPGRGASRTDLQTKCPTVGAPFAGNPPRFLEALVHAAPGTFVGMAPSVLGIGSTPIQGWEGPIERNP